MRVGIIGFLHESNTFISERTTLAHFKQDTLLSGAAVRDRFADRRNSGCTRQSFAVDGRFNQRIDRLSNESAS